MKVKITTNVQMMFWMLITFLVFIFLPEKWALNQDFLKPFFSFVGSIFPGIQKLSSISTYPETMKVLFSVMWLTVPLQIAGYTYTNYIRMEEEHTNPPVLVSVSIFVVSLGIFFWSGLGIGVAGLHHNVGLIGDLSNLMYTNILGVIIHVYIIVAVFSLTVALVMAQLFLHLNHKNELKEK